MMNNTMANENGNNVVVVTEKLTKKDCFNLLEDIVKASGSENRDKLLEFIKNEISLLEKKASKVREKRSTGANQGIRDNILAVLNESEKAMNIGDMLEDARLTTYKDGETIVKMTNQKLSSLLTKLKDEGLVTKEIIKKRPYYSIVR